MASVWIESLLRKACVSNPATLHHVKFLIRLLDEHWLNLAIDAMEECGVFDGVGDQAWASSGFKSYHDLQQRCDEIISSNPDNPAFQIEDDGEWEEADDLTQSELEWLSTVTLEDLTKRQGNLRAYVDLAKVVGPRALDAERMADHSQLRAMAGESGGGQLLIALKFFYLPPSQSSSVHPLFLSKRLTDFMIDTAWPYLFDLEQPDYLEAAFDLTHRCQWAKATKE